MSKLDPQIAVQSLANIEAIPSILEVVCRTTGMGFAAVAKVTDQQWVACAVRDEIGFGLKPGGELQLETTLCNEIRQHHQPIVIDEVAADPRYVTHHTPKTYGLQSYISFPVILSDGTFFGTLCAIDPKPHRLETPAVVGMFKLFADLIAFHLDARQRLFTSESSLKSERETSELREQFIAVLGHDLRNPLAAVDAGALYLGRRIEDPDQKSVIDQMRTSVARMALLIDNVLDLARGRLGGGIDIAKAEAVALKPVLQQILAEFCASHPERVIRDALIDVSAPCDPGRIGQLLSNLVANAVAHGKPGGAILVQSSAADGVFDLSVCNTGDPIPAHLIGNMFKPFFRSEISSREGLGLGLYICSEIARAHGGTLSVSSNAEETRFSFRMPLQA